MAADIRLFVDHPLSQGQSVPLNRGQSNYLFAVMRLSVGAEVLVFNGTQGEWRAEVRVAGKRQGLLEIGAQTRPLQPPPDLWLLFAPIKKARTDFIVEKATELGACRICPVATDRTNAGRIQQTRLQAHAVEAAEQCGGTFVPDVTALHTLDHMLRNWDESRQILFCDEALASHKANGAGPWPAGVVHGSDLRDPGPWAVLIGPEGGFSPPERARLQALPWCHAIGLGPRILRADTAAVAALTVWQTTLGDWL